MRRKDREITEIAQIEDIVRRASYLHLGLNDDGYPYVVPMHYGYEWKDHAFQFYMHGAKQGHKKDLIERDSRVFVQIDTDVELIAGDMACDHSSAYASFMGRGTIEILEEQEEKEYALDLLMKHQTGKSFAFNPFMVAAVDVYKVTIKEFSGKSRVKK